MQCKIKIEENYIRNEDRMITRLVVYLPEQGMAKYIQFNKEQPIELRELVPNLYNLCKELEKLL